MQTSRILWLIWCGVWTVLWSVLGFISLAPAAFGATRPAGACLLMAVLSIGAMFMPVGSERKYQRYNNTSHKWENMS
jgi:hypothetical protein